MSKQIDAYSFALGVCEAFCEVVRAGVKRIALSHPFTEDELQNALGADFLPACVKQSPESTAAKRII